MTSITDPLVHLTSFTYDASRRLETTKDPFGGTVTQTYDTTSGEVATFVDQLVRTTTYLRDTMGRATTITHADGNNERFTYNTAGMLAYHYNKMGVPDSPFYDTFGRGQVMAYSEGSAMRMTMSSFDVAGRATGSRDGRGFWTYFTLDGVGNATASTDAKSNTTASAFDLASQMLTSRDQMGNWTDFAYNSRGWMTTTTDPLNNLWTTTFNAVGNVTSTDDPLGHGGATTYDALNRVSTSTDARGYVTTQTYWADGRAKDTTDPLGIVMRSDLDFTNKKYTTTNAYGIGAAVTTESNFDLAGQTTSSKDGLGHFTTYTKNSVGDTTAMTDALNHTMTYTVDAEGRTTRITDALGKFTTLTVDLLGRQVKAFDAALGGDTTMFDPESNVVANVDGMANQTKNIYDQLGNLVLTIDGLNGTTRREYDALSRLVAYTDPSGNKTLYEYNELSQLTKVTDPNAGTMTFVYDAAGRETSRTDQLGRVKDFTYLDNNVLSTEVWKSGGSTVNTLTFTYSATSQLLTAADANGTISFTYDDLSRQKSVTDVWGITLTNSYDAASRLTSVADELGGLREYTWDNADRMTVEKYSDASAQLRLDFTYSVRDQITQIDRYTDTAGTSLKSQTVYGLDDEGKALTITHKNSGGTTVDSFTYQYDLADRITRETSTLGPTNTYTYDRTSQVTGDGTESFAWDANGNPTGGGNTVTTGNRLTSDGTWTYTHDDAGNVIEKAKSGEYWFYGYDHNNRLTHLEKRTTEGGSSVLSVDFKYNIFGDRIERDYDADGAGAGAAVVLKMAYENGNAWADMDSGLTVSTRRVYEGGLDSMVARINSGSQEDWYLTDVIGSVRDIVNGSGTLIDHLDYSVFGTPTETQPGSGDRYKFTGREWETEALIQYNRARYLQNGRWMSQDPLGFDAGDSNLYRYVVNNPPGSIDPLGLVDPDNPWREGTIRKNAVQVGTVFEETFVKELGRKITVKMGRNYLVIRYQASVKEASLFMDFKEMWQIKPAYFAKKLQEMRANEEMANDLHSEARPFLIAGGMMMATAGITKVILELGGSFFEKLIPYWGTAKVAVGAAGVIVWNHGWQLAKEADILQVNAEKIRSDLENGIVPNAQTDVKFVSIAGTESLGKWGDPKLVTRETDFPIMNPMDAKEAAGMQVSKLPRKTYLPIKGRDKILVDLP